MSSEVPGFVPEVAKVAQPEEPTYDFAARNARLFKHVQNRLTEAGPEENYTPVVEQTSSQRFLDQLRQQVPQATEAQQVNARLRRQFGK